MSDIEMRRGMRALLSGGVGQLSDEEVERLLDAFKQEHRMRKQRVERALLEAGFGTSWAWNGTRLMSPRFAMSGWHAVTVRTGKAGQGHRHYVSVLHLNHKDKKAGCRLLCGKWLNNVPASRFVQGIGYRLDEGKSLSGRGACPTCNSTQTFLRRRTVHVTTPDEYAAFVKRGEAELEAASGR